jgi:hypothetical protein
MYSNRRRRHSHDRVIWALLDEASRFHDNITRTGMHGIYMPKSTHDADVTANARARCPLGARSVAHHVTDRVTKFTPTLVLGRIIIRFSRKTDRPPA